MNLAKSTPAGIKTLHEQMRPLIDQNVREVEKRKQSGTAVTPHPNWFKMLEEAPVVVRIPHFDSIADGIIQHGRLRNLFETGKGMGVQNKGIRQEAEHNVLNIPLDTPETERPIYGMLGIDHYMHNNGIVHEKRFELAPSPHYGSIIAVVKPHVKERSSFVEGDSLDHKKEHTLFDSKTLHNFPYVAMNGFLDPHERYSAFGDPVDVTGVSYIEAQIHGGVDFAKDVDSLHVRMPKSFFHENPHELVNMANSMKQEVDKLEGTPVFLMTQEQRSRTELLRARIENVRSLLSAQRIGKHFGIPVHAHLIDDSGQQKKRFIRESDIDGPRVGTHVFSFAQQAPNTTDTLELLNRFEQALDNLAKMAKPNVTFPQLSTRSPSAAPIVRPAIIPYRAGLMGQNPSADYSQTAGATIQRGTSKPVKEEGKAGRANPTFHQSGFITSGRTGREIAATEGHEKWHAALQDLRAKYHPAAVFDLVTKLGGRVHNDIYANPVSKHLFDIAVKETPAEQKNASPYEEFFAYVHTFLNDPTFRKRVHENLGMTDVQAQRDAYKHVDNIRKQAQTFADTFDESMIDPQYIPKTTQAPTGVTKSESLIKVSRTPEEMSAGMTPHKPSHYEAYDTIETFPVGEMEWMNGRKGMLYHHVYKKPATKNGYVSYLHAISVDPNPLNETGIISSSTMGTESVQKFLADPFPAPKNKVNIPWKDGEVASIGETATDVPAQNRGLATLLYLDALKYHGRLMSDTLTSEGADKVWDKILKHPEVNGCHGHGDPFHRHWAEWKGDKSVPSNVIQMGGKSIAQMKLGKSEDSEVFYHGTLEEHLPSILAHGLNPNQKMLWVSNRRNSAANWARHRSLYWVGREVHYKPSAVLRFKTPIVTQEDPNLPETPESSITYHRIPPEDIEIAVGNPFDENVVWRPLHEHLKIFKSEDLAKGLRGDWRNEGYTFNVIHHEDHPKFGGEAVEVQAYHPQHGHVGGTLVRIGEEGEWTPSMTEVLPKHRRKGLANEMYRLAEERLGESLSPDYSQTKDARKLWAQPSRPFGKSEDILDTLNKFEEMFDLLLKNEAARKFFPDMDEHWQHLDQHYPLPKWEQSHREQFGEWTPHGDPEKYYNAASAEELGNHAKTDLGHASNRRILLGLTNKIAQTINPHTSTGIEDIQFSGMENANYLGQYEPTLRQITMLPTQGFKITRPLFDLFGGNATGFSDHLFDGWRTLVHEAAHAASTANVFHAYEPFHMEKRPHAALEEATTELLAQHYTPQVIDGFGLGREHRLRPPNALDHFNISPEGEATLIRPTAYYTHCNQFGKLIAATEGIASVGNWRESGDWKPALQEQNRLNQAILHWAHRLKSSDNSNSRYFDICKSMIQNRLKAGQSDITDPNGELSMMGHNATWFLYDNIVNQLHFLEGNIPQLKIEEALHKTAKRYGFEVR